MIIKRSEHVQIGCQVVVIQLHLTGLEGAFPEGDDYKRPCASAELV